MLISVKWNKQDTFMNTSYTDTTTYFVLNLYLFIILVNLNVKQPRKATWQDEISQSVISWSAFNLLDNFVKKT